MTASNILGDMAVDADGMVNGWCWAPDRPDERLTVDILVDDRVVISLVASRFREDIKHYKYGDGHHGFSAVLSRQISEMGSGGVLSARERSSGRVFFQQLRGELPLSETFPADLQNAAADLHALAGAASWSARSGLAPLPAALGVLGARLKAKVETTPPSPKPAWRLPPVTSPGLSIVYNADGAAADTLAALRHLAPALQALRAELIAADGGADETLLAAQRGIAGLRYLFEAGAPPARLRNAAGRLARGETLLWLESAGDESAAALALLQAQPSLVVPAWVGEAAARLQPNLAARFTSLPAPAGLTLGCAVPRATWARLDGFNESLDDGAGLDILDFCLRAALAGEPVSIWHPPWAPARPREVTNPEAGDRFAAKWTLYYREPSP